MGVASIRVLCVFGTRPEAIKMAPVVSELYKHPGQVQTKVCVTAQHRDMLDQVLGLFQIVPDYDLNIMKESQSPAQVAASVLVNLEPVLRAERPDWVLVQGDTTTAAAAALGAFYGGTRVGHVEAGLRTLDKYHPFPEEINRRIGSVIADLHFAPTQHARQNLLREGISDRAILVTGNTVIDALQWAVAQPVDGSSSVLLQRLATWGGAAPAGSVDTGRPRLILVTAHRRENFGRPLEQICLALREIALAYAGSVQIVYPVHPNPCVRETVYPLLKDVPGILLTEPLDYLSLVHLMKRATLILTDSGGLQEEAPGLGKPVLVLREVTERVEAVEAGTVRLVGRRSADIVEWTRRLLDDSNEYQKMARASNPYGDGQAAGRIVEGLIEAGRMALR